MLSSVPDRLDHHEKLIGRFVQLLLNNVLGTWNMVTFHHVTGHKTAPSRLEQKPPSRGSNRRKNKNRNQEPFHPEGTHKGSARPAPCSPSGSRDLGCPKPKPLLSPFRVSRRLFRDIQFAGCCFIFFFTTSYSGLLLPVSDWRKTG